MLADGADGADGTVLDSIVETPGWADGPLASKRRTWVDVLAGRQEFIAGLYCFTVERGHITYHRLIAFVSYGIEIVR